MPSTQKILLIILAINIILGIITQIYIDVDNFSEEIIENEAEYLQGLETDFEDEETLYGGLSNENYQEQQVIGNKLKWSKLIFKGLFRGLVPFYPREYSPETNIEIILKNGFILLRVFMYMLVALEVYMFLVNKKTS